MKHITLTLWTRCIDASEARMVAVGLGVLLFVGGCGLFGDGDDASSDSGTSGASAGSTSGVSSDGGETTSAGPTQGIRVLPRYRLQDISAVVTLHEGVLDPRSCALDSSEGGYLCDAGDVASTVVQISAERDGFERATADVPIAPTEIVSVTLHLIPDGEPTATWSECLLDIDVESCDVVCEATALGCAPASCASDDPFEPHATVRRFDGPDCTGTPTAASPLPCDAATEGDGTSWLQCCCEP
jgi:hypothetical protein